jgi:hypothetical protein
MESGIFQIGIFLKWLAIGAVGSGLSVFLDKEPKTFWTKCALFLFGAFIAIIAGAALIEVFQIKSPAVQGFAYWACGLWGMGIIIGITKQIPKVLDLLPEGAKNLIEKYTK